MKFLVDFSDSIKDMLPTNKKLKMNDKLKSVCTITLVDYFDINLSE